VIADTSERGLERLACEAEEFEMLNEIGSAYDADRARGDDTGEVPEDVLA
jgi:hypothetical protein